MPDQEDLPRSRRRRRLSAADEQRRAQDAMHVGATLEAVHRSRWDASRCGGCGRQMTATEPVWRWRRQWQNRWGRLVHGSVNLCSDCRPDLLGWPPPFRCARCSRDVYAYSGWAELAGRLREVAIGYRGGRFCSHLCAQRHRRGVPRVGNFFCAACHQAIARPSKRRRYCSAACKQQHWRDSHRKSKAATLEAT